ncbi:hypothetical protein HMPREF1982_00592 [Clostridiales bacterium oral taxon 876 str. F0540]|nr:hypothetical protein HMPREF1982_00592 [Clostridiales bacterium oral taxon 876 str. F0540]
MARRNVNIFNIRTKRKKKIYVKAGSNYEIKENIKASKVLLNDNNFIQSLIKYIGQTITIYTVSGGESGSGFTGVLLDVKKDYIKVLSRLASPPCIPEEYCNSEEGSAELNNNEISLGAVTNIPINKIAAFVHNTI